MMLAGGLQSYAGTVTNLLFTEDWESPVVSGYDQQPPTPTGWVAASMGYRSSWHGLHNKDSGDYTAPAGNDQVISFRYSNSGITTGDGVISELRADVTYTISFDVVSDVVDATETAYNVQLIAFASGAVRNDCRSTPAGSSLLASSSGNSATDGSWTTSITFTFYANPTTYAADIGKDLAIRLKGSTSSANIDNVLVTDDFAGNALIFQIR